MIGGATVAWQAALMRPRPFSRRRRSQGVPFRPRGKERPTSVMPRTAGRAILPVVFSGTRPRRGGNWRRDPRATVRNMLFGRVGRCAAPAGVGGAEAGIGMGAARKRFSCAARERRQNCRHGSARADVDFYAGEFQPHRLPRRAELLS